MDTRLVVTASFVAALVAGAIFAGGAVASDVTFTSGQDAFVAGVGFGGSFVGLVLLWFRNYVYGSALYTLSMVSTSWFVAYFFVVHDNPASVFAVTGSGRPAYAMGVAGLFVVTLIGSLVGGWVWYRSSPGFRTVLHGLVGTDRSS
ncbi:hypothetical protein [Halovivax cerinus]|uniref:Uncharacterized protein n=1 Tax=Halovivax cerinus TaxID=1487865 RepID=A0ABD5NS89_9EURY|nr:hypothetical protein [Halovivax cerinus]